MISLLTCVHSVYRFSTLLTCVRFFFIYCVFVWVIFASRTCRTCRILFINFRLGNVPYDMFNVVCFLTQEVCGITIYIKLLKNKYLQAVR